MRGIDGIIYINLDHRTDRKALIEQELNRLRIPQEKIFRLGAVFDRLNGTKGCMLSHIKALELAQKMGWERTLILEDDAFFIEGRETIESALSTFYGAVGSEWDVFFLGGTYLEREKTTKDTLFLIRKGLASHAYLIHRPYVDKLRTCFLITYDIIKDHLLSAQSLQYSLDQVWVILQKEDRWYAFQDSFVVQRESPSDIDIVAEPLNRFLRVIYIDTGHQDSLFKEFSRLRFDCEKVHRAESHLGAIEKAMELKRGRTLILEDTATFSENIEDLDQKIIHFHRWRGRDWNLFLLDGDHSEHTQTKHPFFRKVIKLYRPKAYAVNDTFYPLLYRHFSKGEGLETLDLSSERGIFCVPT
jgi:GR25 family glycosyltransferase involved in LPS biosynthesis